MRRPGSTRQAAPAPAEVEQEGKLFGGRIPLGTRTMRSLVAGGVLVNGIYQILLVTLGFLKGFVVVAFLSREDYGVWGILLISVLTITWIKEVGIADKFVQQSEDDQQAAWQKAFTFELCVGLIAMVTFAALTPLIAWAYGESRLLAPGLVMALVIPLGALQAPLWILYRRMEFAKQRLLQAIDPVVGLVVAIVLAVGGAGYWALVVGTIAGLLAGGFAAVLACPYRFRLRFDLEAARGYFSFSWPLLLAGGSSLAIAQGSVIAGEAALGLAGAGTIVFAAAIAQYADRVDGVLTATLYPAICAVSDRSDLLFESFWKSNRVALMWGIPFGLGLTLFAGDLIEFVIGDEWQAALILLQVFGLVTGLAHVGFNWSAFYRAQGQTRPIAVWSGLSMVTFFVLPLPLLLLEGLDGYAWGMAATAGVSLAIRAFYIRRMFDRFRFIRYSLRAMAPSVPAAGVVVLVRAVEDGQRTMAAAAAEVLLYVVVTVAATAWFERALLRELLSYVRGAAGAPHAARSPWHSATAPAVSRSTSRP